MGNIKELNEKEFASKIRSGVTLVDFWAPWCAPCLIQGNILLKVADRIGGKATIAKVNVDLAPSIAGQFGIRSIPTLILFKDGQAVQTMIGVQQENTLVSAIESVL